jgi:hypothetical protein
MIPGFGFNLLPVLGISFFLLFSLILTFLFMFIGVYQLIYYKSVVLRAPPSILRVCTVLATVIAIAVFILSYYFTATTPTTETTVSYEPLASYSCNVLSPRSDSVTFNSAKNSIVEFSKARFNYNECLTALNGICSDSYRTDYLLSVGGIGTENGKCYDLILADGYRFCQIEESDKSLLSAQISNSFSGTLERPDVQYSKQYYFMKENGKVSSQGSLSADMDILTDFISDSSSNIYVAQAASPNSAVVYHMKPVIPKLQGNVATTEPQKLFTVGTINIHGIAYGNDEVFVLEIGSTNLGRVYAYNMTSKAIRQSSSFTCTLSSGSAAGATKRMISYGTTDHKLYVFCDNTVEQGGTNQGNFPFYQFNTVTLTPVSKSAKLGIFHYMLSDGSSTTSNITGIEQVLSVGKYLYFVTSGNSNTNLLQADTSLLANSNNITVLSNLGYVESDNAITHINQLIVYFPESNNKQYYDVATQSFKTNYSYVNHENYYLATYVKLGYSYQTCNGEYTHYSVRSDESTSFAIACSAING